jgi:DNA-binding ferritin-like protein (Dps family)
MEDKPIFGDIVGKLDRHFLIGHLLPILLFIALNLWLESAELLPINLLPLLRTFGLNWGIPLVLTAALCGGILLVALNRSIIMLYEGYPIQRFRLFRFLTTRQRREWHKLNYRLKRLKKEYRKMPEGEKNPRAQAIVSEITRLQDRANNCFPPQPEAVLPTRLGNAIRAFEFYASERYKIDPITLWSRLVTVLPKEFLERVKEVRTYFNFLVNTMLLLQLIGLELLVAAACNTSYWPLLGTLTNFVISYVIYRAAVSRAIDWGFLFNTAFDLYRRDLLKQFGFRPPSKIEEEQELWIKILQLIMYKKTKDLAFNGQKVDKNREGQFSIRRDDS